MKTRLPVAACVLVLLCAPGARAATVVVQSTTDTVDAGLVDGTGADNGFSLRSAYKAATGNDLDYTGVGTGAALTNAETNGADVVITHDPTAEQSFVNQGYSLEPQGRAIFYSDYVIVGPASDPAGVFTGGAPAHDAVGAYEKIAAAGAAGKAHFLSRTGSSAAAPGTTAQEERIWNLTTSLPLQQAKDKNATSDEKQPSDGSGNYPSWYVATGAGGTTAPGQSVTVQATENCAPSSSNRDCYTMTDRGTFNRLFSASPNTIPDLKIVDDRNDPGARGGANLLINPFMAYIVNPTPPAGKSYASHQPNADLARNFLDFLTSAGFQTQVDGFPTAVDPAFHSDAFPLVTGAPPTTGTIGAAVPLSVTLSNKVPGGGPVAQPGPSGTPARVTAISGLPVQLQQSVDGGKTFTNIGGPVSTDANGTASFAPALTATTTYRVDLPRYAQFSPTQQVIGTTAGVAPAVPTGPSPIPAKPAADTTPPSVSKAKLSGKKLSLSISEAGTVKATFARRTRRVVKGKKRTSYKSVKSVTLKASKAGTVSKSFAALAAGTYHVTLRASDAAGNVKSRTVTLVVKAARKR